MTFGVGASTHRPKYRLWLGLYIITKEFYLFLLDFFQIFAEEIAFFHIYGFNTGIGCQPCAVLE